MLETKSVVYTLKSLVSRKNTHKLFQVSTPPTPKKKQEWSKTLKEESPN